MSWLKHITDQNGYGSIETDNTEKDIVSIWFNEPEESNVVMVKRENLPLLISELQRCLEVGKEPLP
jgi:hypothetical protein